MTRTLRLARESGPCVRPPRRGRPSRHQQRGQSTVEFVLVTPFFALMLLTIIQVGLLVRTRVLVTHATREAVRAAAVGGTDAEVRSAAAAAAGLDPRRLQVLVRRSGGRATVELQYREATDVVVVGSLVGDATFESRATMRLE